MNRPFNEINPIRDELTGRTYYRLETPHGYIDTRISISGFALDSGDATTDYMFSDEYATYLNSREDFTSPDEHTMYPIENFKLASFLQEDKETTLNVAEGLTVIYGKTSSGKSELMKRMMSATDPEIYKFVRFHEPELPSIVSIERLLIEMYEFLESDKKIMYIDSFRFLIFNTGSRRAAGKGGISSAFYSDLTALSVIAGCMKKSFVVVVNPMTKDSTEMEIIANSLEGSVTSVFNSRSYGNFSVTSRDLISQRDHVAFTFDPNYVPNYQVTREKIIENVNECIDLEVSTSSTKSADVTAARAFTRLFK